MALEQHAVTTTISCSVSGGEGHLTGEIDSRPYGLNGGRSQYFPGDDCFVLIYKSINVTIMGSFVTGGNFSHNVPGLSVGYNIVREGLSFSSPVANFSKPAPPNLIVLNALYLQSGGFTFVPNTTVARLLTWVGSGDPAAQPPYAFVFVEYSPTAQIGKFSNLPSPPTGSVFSWPVHAVLYGIATPVYP